MGRVITNKSKIDILLTKGVEKVFIKENLRKALLSGKQLRVKLGFDPTGSRIHLGRAVILRKLKEFQDLGHKIIFLVGDFTALVGDPSDKLGKRPMLTPKQVKKNLKLYKKQVGKIIDLKKAEFKFNSKWLRKLDFKEIAQLAESFSVQQMLARRNFKNRWSKQEEISIREFLYPLMQGYDSVVLKADVEIGGFDQLFNLKAGRTIQKKYRQPEQNILTTQMLEGLDGRKMSTSWGNVVNITDAPKDMFGKLMSLKDDLIEKYFLLCTDLERSEIKKVISKGHKEAKIKLAHTIVSIYHDTDKANKAKQEFLNVFSSKQKPSRIRKKKISATEIALANLLVEVNLASSKNEARRLIEQGGVRIDETKRTNPQEKINLSKEILVQVGPRRFLKVSGN